MIVLVTGDRNWEDYDLIYKELKALQPQPDLLIHGAARGADTLAGVAAMDLGIKTRAFPAHWDRYGKAAGPMRNQEMLLFLIHPSNRDHKKLVMAFHDNLEQSKGTADMVLRSERALLEVRKFGHTLVGERGPELTVLTEEEE